MKYQNLFSGKNKKNISMCSLMKILPRVLSVNQKSVLVFSSPGLSPWRAYVVTQSLVSATVSALAQCLSFQRFA